VIDPENPIVKLCAAGMAAESAEGHEAAAALFNKAWDASQNDYEACIAAHYVARHQPTPEESLRWNEVALERGIASGDERVNSFYPSLYLCVGKAHAALGNLVDARSNYAEAGKWVGALPKDGYGEFLRKAVGDALKSA